MGKAIGLRPLQDDAIDTTTAPGGLIFVIFLSWPQFKRRLIQETAGATMQPPPDAMPHEFPLPWRARAG